MQQGPNPCEVAVAGCESPANAYYRLNIRSRCKLCGRRACKNCSRVARLGKQRQRICAECEKERNRALRGVS